MVVCPGRGVYNAPELGYLKQHHANKFDLFEQFDLQRRALDQAPIIDLDGAERFSISKYTRGDNASGLIFACSYADFIDINRDTFEIVAVTGNSMGWYTTLACGGALSADDGFKVVNTMGDIMQKQLIGGQLIYPIVDENWQEAPELRNRILTLVEKVGDLHVSIQLGGMVVLAGTPEALEQAENSLPPVQERFPMRLANHAAFHSPLLEPNSQAGKQALPESLFSQPSLPMIDGRGEIWTPHASNLSALWDYTFGEQVTDTYDFTRAIQTGLKEFAPDCLIVLGPGNTLGGATAQSMLGLNWQSMSSKQDFAERQAADPYLLAMGHKSQRAQTITPT